MSDAHPTTSALRSREPSPHFKAAGAGRGGGAAGSAGISAGREFGVGLVGSKTGQGELNVVTRSARGQGPRKRRVPGPRGDRRAAFSSPGGCTQQPVFRTRGGLSQLPSLVRVLWGRPAQGKRAFWALARGISGQRGESGCASATISRNVFELPASAYLSAEQFTHFPFKF